MFTFPQFIETADKQCFAERLAALHLWMSSFSVIIDDTGELIQSFGNSKYEIFQLETKQLAFSYLTIFLNIIENSLIKV